MGVVAADDALLLDPLPLLPVVLLSLLAYSWASRLPPRTSFDFLLLPDLVPRSHGLRMSLLIMLAAGNKETASRRKTGGAASPYGP